MLVDRESCYVKSLKLTAVKPCDVIYGLKIILLILDLNYNMNPADVINKAFLELSHRLVPSDTFLKNGNMAVNEVKYYGNIK